MRPDLIHQARDLSQADFAQWGVNEIAFVKATTTDEGAAAWAIHGADGTQLAVVGDRDQAFAVVRQNELEPVSVH